jgi:molecular chaperone IbpA
MKNVDWTPFWRSTVGFDRLFDLLDDASERPGNEYTPPYNIERTGEDSYRIVLALAGFTPDDVTVTAEQNTLVVEGRKADPDPQRCLYQGISAQPFRCHFDLADYVEVKGAAFQDGLLQIELVREVPESMKPRRIAIRSGAGADKQLQQHAA